MQALARSMKSYVARGAPATELKQLRAASKALKRASSEPLFVLVATLEFYNTTLDAFGWPYDKLPLDMTTEEILAIDPFLLDILSTMLDREGNQHPGP